MLDARIARDVVPNTLVDYPRLHKLVELVQWINYWSIEGHIAEVGVYKGGTALLLASYMPVDKRLFLFDTFSGLPTVKAGVDEHHKGDFSDTSIQHVDSILPKHVKYSIYKGIFPKENSEYITHHKFSLVHIDVDIYDSVYDCLSFFIPRMAKGGIIVLDDYNAVECPGAKLAVDDFCQRNPLYKVELTIQCQAIIRIENT